MNETVSECQKISDKVERWSQQIAGWSMDTHRREIQSIPRIAQTQFLTTEARLLQTTLERYRSWFVDAVDESKKITSAAATKVGFGATDDELVDFKDRSQLLERHAKNLYEQANTIYQAAMSLRNGE